MTLIIGALFVLLLFFVPAALGLSALALGCAGLFRRVLRRPALSRAVRGLIFAVVITGVRLACLWLTRAPRGDCMAGDILFGAVVLPETMAGELLHAHRAQLVLSGLLTLGDSVLWVLLLARLADGLGTPRSLPRRRA